ncbi:MAG: hypothetical protein ISP32_02280 [Thermoleophilia bacterium]|nr:hypothetical protein [Thermoleophilia bacterium]
MSRSLLDAQSVLAWMQAHPARLRELLAEEDPGDVDVQPAADSAVRAHLRFAAEGLMAGVAPGLADRVEGMGDDLDDWFAAHSDLFDRQVELGQGAIALEEHLLYGADGHTEPAIHAALERRVRLGAWQMLFLRCLESRLGPEYDGLTESALAWAKERERDLAATILHMHHRQVTAMVEATGHAATAQERDQSSQAAAVQGYVRQAIEAAAHAMARA